MFGTSPATNRLTSTTPTRSVAALPPFAALRLRPGMHWETERIDPAPHAGAYLCVQCFTRAVFTTFKRLYNR